jgi:ABC-type Fe3+-hydroxamate transport system substrate-binding protein
MSFFNHEVRSTDYTRIISLVPSQTELLADLGLEDRVIGITKFCIHPDHWRKTKAIIGGTKKFDLQFIQSLNPDLIIGNKEENYPEGINELQKHYPVWMSDIVTINDALTMIQDIGEVTGTRKTAHVILNSIEKEFLKIQKLNSRKTLYLIWKNPWMAAASGTFIHEMMGLSGLENCLNDKSRYPELASEEIKQLNPELILLSSEPYPFKGKHIKELQQLCPKARIFLVDGEMFSWYGSRLLKFPAYLESLRKALY